MWLREWRILFMADPIENLEIVDELHQMLDKLISDFKPLLVTFNSYYLKPIAVYYLCILILVIVLF